MKVLICCLSHNFTLLTYQESFPCTHNFYIVFASDTDTGESEGNGIHHDGMDHPSIVYGPVNRPLPVKNESSDVTQVISMHKCDDDGMYHPSIVYGPVNQPLPVKNESSDVKQVILCINVMMMVWTTLALSMVLLIDLFQ